jgi:hypothetical protein
MDKGSQLRQYDGGRREAVRAEVISSKSRRERRTIAFEALNIGIRHPRGEIEGNNVDFAGITIPTGF